METNLFPHIYNQQVDKRTREKINTARGQNHSRINSINQQHTSKPSGDGTILGWILGVVGGFVSCTCVTFNSGDFGSGLNALFIIPLICGLLGWVINESSKSSYESNEADIASRISKSNNELNAEIQRIEGEAESEKQRYLFAFESNAKNMSVQFAESELAKEVIEWMTSGFAKIIDSADRRAHVEQIVVPFQFKVYANAIACNLGTYDFVLKRCRNLTSQLEQTALARAIAAAIQLNIIMKYPKDVSGKDISIKIDYSFSNDCPVTTITYVAPNGNYEVARSWENNKE